MSHTNWKQEFYSLVDPIAMRDPLASALGAINDDEPIYYSYTDCVKAAGHACASVSSAFQMTKLALKELYGNQLPERGGIVVRFAGPRDFGANGPIGQVIQYITGAAIETGFKGLGGKHVRAGKFEYDENLNKGAGNAIMAEFERVDTGEKVAVYANPGLIPMSDEDRENAQMMTTAIHGDPTNEEREKFFRFWQGKNRKILLEDHPGVFTVERIK